MSVHSRAPASTIRPTLPRAVKRGVPPPFHSVHTPYYYDGELHSIHKYICLSLNRGRRLYCYLGGCKLVDFVCQRSDLARGIATVERAVGAHDDREILEGILIRADGDRLQLVATNLELAIECYVPAVIRRPGAAVLNGRVLGQIVRKLGGDDVVYTTEENKTARIESGRSRFTVHTMDADDFPSLPQVDAGPMWRISQGQLKRMIRHTAFAAAADDSRPFLTGVLFEVEEGELRLVATDSSRLSYYESRLKEPAAQGGTGIVPLPCLTELARILDSDDETDVEFTVTESQAVFCLPDARVISRVIEGRFPDYRRVMVVDQPCKFTLSRQELYDAIERVSLVARRNTPIVRVKVADGLLALSAHEAEVGQAFEEIPVAQQGQDHETAYQARYLLEVLRAMDADEIEVGLGEGLRQGSIRAVGDEAFIYIVMPVRVG